MRKWTSLGLAVACACGGGSSPRAGDAGTDAAVDPLDAPSLAPVDVVVIKGDGTGDPDTTASVIFADAAGAVLADVVVDAQGRAQATVPAGGMVTVLQVSTLTASDVYAGIITFRGVQPGDHLRAGGRTVPPQQTGVHDRMTASYTLPAPTQSIAFMTPCGGGSLGGSNPPQTGVVLFDFYGGCRTPTFDVFAIHDSTLGQHTFLWQPDNVFIADEMFTLADSWKPFTQTTITLANVPAERMAAGARETILVGDVPFEIDNPNQQLPPAGTLVLPMRYPAGAGRASILQAGASKGIFGGGDLTTVVMHAAPANLTIDLSGFVLPDVDRPPAQTTTTVTWTETPGGSPDVRHITWLGSWTTSTQQHHVFWTIVEDPAGPTSSVLPGLPAGHAEHDPTQALNVSLDGAVVTYIDYDILAGYDAARRHGAALQDPATILLDVDHRARVTTSRCQSATHGPC